MCAFEFVFIPLLFYLQLNGLQVNRRIIEWFGLEGTLRII